MKLLKKYFLIIVSLIPCSCSTHYADFTAISTKDVVAENLNLNDFQQKEDVIGEDKMYYFLFLPIGRLKLERAVDNALKNGDGDLILNASVETRNWWFLIGQHKMVLNGTVVNTKKEK